MNDQFIPVSWSKNTNIYEVNLRQYTQEGTFQEFEKELPRLKDMGIEILWFMPITPISKEKRLGTLGSYYACADYTTTNPEFGSIDDFKQLVATAHNLQFKVIIDWVANHTGWDHRWTWEHPEFYRLNHDGNFYDAHGWSDVIDLNYDLPELHETMLNEMKFWIQECDIDGFRCDMAMLVPLSFWKMVRSELDKIKKLFWLAECEDVAYHEVFDVTYTWKFLHCMEAFWRKETGIEGLAHVLQYYHSMFPPKAMHAFFTTNHDENSHSGSEYERLGSAALALSVLCCTWNGIPLIYSGQEMPNKKRLKFFDKDTIEWNGQYELHDFFKKLLSLRKSNPALQVNETEIHRLSGNQDWCIFSFIRKNGDDEVFVILNLSHEEKISISLNMNLSGRFRNIFNGDEKELSESSRFNIQAWNYEVYEKM
ncbi:MAG: alpha-amylase family glycosyl hydrolase [Chitinophagaceae bacterium]